MIPPGKAIPRFVPTLTEVVQPEPEEGATPAQQAILEQVLHRVLPALAEQLRASMREAMQEQLAHMEQRLEHEIDIAVRHAVGVAMAELSPTPQADA